MASSNTASNTSATPLLGASESRSLGDSEIQVIVVSPAVDSSVQEMEEGERGDSTAASSQQDRGPSEEREGERGQNDHIGVDIEGLGLPHPTPVANA